MFYGEKKEKSEIASLCKTYSQLAEDGDALSRWIFYEAGKELAKFVQSLYPGADKVRSSINITFFKKMFIYV